MAKIIVVVNEKFLTKVTAESSLAAEHHVLNLIYGAKIAQAFQGAELETYTFKQYLEKAGFISFSELKKRGERLEEATRLKKEYQNLVEANNEKIAKLEEEINNLKQSTANIGSQIGEYLRIESEGL